MNKPLSQNLQNTDNLQGLVSVSATKMDISGSVHEKKKT